MSYAMPSRRQTREHRRYSVDLPVRFADDSNLRRKEIVMHAGWTRNISRKGLCVYTDHDVPVGSELTLEVGTDGTELVLRGTVVWVGYRGHTSPEIGIELTASEIDPSLFEWLLSTGTE